MEMEKILDMLSSATVETAENEMSHEKAQGFSNAENIVNNSSQLKVRKEFNIQQPSSVDAVLVSVDDIQKLRELSTQLKKKKTSFIDFLFGAATLLIGGTISAAISGIKLETPIKGWAFYIACPVVGVGIIVACIFLKILRNKDDQLLAERIISIIESIGEGGLSS